MTRQIILECLSQPVKMHLVTMFLFSFCFRASLKPFFFSLRDASLKNKQSVLLARMLMILMEECFRVLLKDA